MRSGFVTIATGGYTQFLDALIESAAAHNVCDEIFVLTDKAELLERSRSEIRSVDVTYLPYGQLPWPYPTLWRYHGIASYSELFRDRVGHLGYVDVDMLFVGPCGELFGPDLVAVTHPGYLASPPEVLPFSRDPLSTAFVPCSDGRSYVCGGVQAGRTDAFLHAVEVCRQNILGDFSRNVVAVWHDESHWNRLVASTPSVRILGAEFCWPESWVAPEGLPSKRIMALDKDHHALRGTRPTLRERVSKARRAARGRR